MARAGGMLTLFDDDLIITIVINKKELRRLDELDDDELAFHLGRLGVHYVRSWSRKVKEVSVSPFLIESPGEQSTDTRHLKLIKDETDDD